MIIKNGFIFCDDGVFRKMDIEAQNGVITAIGDSLPRQNGESVDAKECYVVPGLVDIHNHGAMGADFSDGTPEAFEKIARFLLSCGVTSFLGTTMTVPAKQLSDVCEIARPLANAIFPDRAVLRGIHLEGPFFSQEKRGAQNPEYILAPDLSLFKSLYEASGENVRLIAVAPEVEGGLEFIKEAARLCTVSVAHSTADYVTAGCAFSLGASHVTHLYNGMSPFNHREPGIIGAAFDSEAYVEIISDGVHVHPVIVRAVFELFGDDRVCLISDSIRACGLVDGQYDLGGQTVTVVGRTATIENNSLAGSVSPLTDCMRRAVEFGVPLTGALKAATINPAKSIGLDAEIGSLSIGKRADMLVLDQDLRLMHTIFGGAELP